MLFRSVSVLFLVAFWGSFKSDDPEETIMLINSLFIYIIALKIIYHGFFVWMYGATPGKMAAKIRVIFIDDIDNPSFSRAFLRASVRVLSEAFFYLGFFWAFMNVKRQTWQDMAAQTLVINAK